MLHDWKPHHFIFIAAFVASGSLNTLIGKGLSRLNITGRDNKKHGFEHPFVLNFLMFMGEFVCMAVFLSLILIAKWTKKERPTSSEGTTNTFEIVTAGNIKFNPLILVVPATCDMIGTGLMFMGLNLTNAASFQMMRGAVIIFVAAASRIFLHRRFPVVSWVGIVVIILGLIIVGLSDYMTTSEEGEKKGTTSIIVGDLLIALAQISTSVQMVVQERFVKPYDIPPLYAVGCEGVFGVIMQGILLVPFYFLTWRYSVNPGRRLEDPITTYYQLKNSGVATGLFSAFPFTISVYNSAGITLTKELSATTRMVLDSIRTIIVWAVSLILVWSEINYLQPLGFLVMTIGMLLYYDILLRKCTMKLWKKMCGRGGEEEETNAEEGEGSEKGAEVGEGADKKEE